MDLFEEFVQLTAQLENQQIEYALCGGLAMAVYAFPRATFDIDILIHKDTLDKEIKANQRTPKIMYCAWGNPIKSEDAKGAKIEV